MGVSKTHQLGSAVAIQGGSAEYRTMSAHSPDLDAVLRLPDVILSREALEIALGSEPNQAVAFAI